MTTGTYDPARRRFLTAAGQGLIAASLGGFTERAVAQAPVTPQPPISLPPFTANTERQEGPPPQPVPPGERIGIAVVGLGNLAVRQILPAFAESKNCRVTALVSGSPDKARTLAREYGVAERSVYDYKTYDALRDSPDVDAVYIVLPNGLHEEYAVRGAEAGKHILCEKPMATSPAECERMIAACRKAGKKLMVAYRIQYEPHNRFLQTFVRAGQYGRVKMIESVNGQNQGDPNQWRQKKALAGGGSLPDVGLYCLNTTRFLLGEEPQEVSAFLYSTPGDARFREVEESVNWLMRFPSGVLSSNATSYGWHESRRYRIHAERGWFGLDPAYSYSGLRMELSYADGAVEYRQTPELESKNQFALEMDHFADCIRHDRTPYTPGEEGLQDHRLMAAIYESARTGKPVALPAILTIDTFRGTPPASV